jgi:peptidoglycan hydrolase-like protein with peptidoglycan-binding domain
VADDWTTFYHGTPYATAPREVQIDVLRKAQEQLARRRLYRGVADGLTGPSTNEAIFLYQEQRRLPRTGRLDLKTLAELDLLPGRGPEAPPLKPFYNPNRRRDLSVDQRGLIR